ncbi:MAG: hypothetical protein KA712_24645 [Myxococcales bacterium]|nr:hypothetical protein [Myxococcales bacterium]
MTSQKEERTPVKPELPPVKANVIEVPVSFRQIDRFYDLVWTNVSKQYLFEGGMVGTVFSWLGRNESADERGQPISQSRQLAGGVYRGMRLQTVPGGMEPFFMRSFDRRASTPIDKKRVYVFLAKDAEGNGLVLQQELDFDKGKFRLCNAEGEPTGPAKEVLLLPALAAMASNVVLLDRYFVMLSAEPLNRVVANDLRAGGSPKDRAAVTKQVAGRVVKLWDPFFTDSSDDNNPDSFAPLNTDSPIASRRVLRLHLIDPVDETVIRAAKYQELYAQWVAECERLGAIPMYRLACQVRALVAGKEKLEEIVGNGRTSGPQSLWDYLGRTEAKSRRLRVALENAGQALLRWLTIEEGPTRVSFVVPAAKDGKFVGLRSPEATTFIFHRCSFIDLAMTPDKYISVPSARPQTRPTNLYVRTLEALQSGKNKDELERFKKLTMQCLTSTNTLPRSDELLAAILARLEEREADSLPEILGEKLGSLGDHVGRPEDLALWLQVAAPVVRSLWKHEFDDLKRLLFKRYKEPDFGDFYSKNKAMLGIAANIFNTVASISTFWDEREVNEGWAALKSTIDTYDDLTGLLKRYELPEIPWSRGMFKGMKLAPVSLLVQSVDCVLKAQEMFAKRNKGAALASGVGTVGAMLGIAGGAVVSGTPLGLALLLGSYLVEKAAGEIAEHFEDLKVFLRNSSWGDDPSSEVTPWSSGKPLSTLRADANAQEKALLEVMFGNFSLDFSFESINGVQHNVDLSVQFQGDYRPPTAMKWDVDLWLKPRTGGGGRMKLGHDGCVQLATERKARLEGPYASPGKNYLFGTVSLDVYGDGKCVIERRVKEETYVV